ncbi:RNA polymerase sigma factor [Streptomyces sp. NPDC004457]
MRHSHEADRAGGDNPSPALSPALEPSHADEADRLAADARLVGILRTDGFKGPRWEKAQQRFMEYGWAVLMKWVKDGQIFDECNKIGRHLAVSDAIRATLRDSRETRSDLVTDTLVTALDIFRESLIVGRWKPGASSLTTYFIGACIMSFPNSYRRWIRSQESRELLLFDDDWEVLTAMAPDLALGDPDPAATVIAKDSEQSLIATLPTNVRKIAKLRALGYTNTEIAEILNLSVHAVETRLARERRRRKRRR